MSWICALPLRMIPHPPSGISKKIKLRYHGRLIPEREITWQLPQWWYFGRWRRLGGGEGRVAVAAINMFMEPLAPRLLLRYSKAVRRAAALWLRAFYGWQVLEAVAGLQLRRGPLQ